VLDQDAVLEDSDLGPVALLAHHHHSVDRLPAGQEFRLGKNRRPGSPLLTSVPAALALRLEPG
jgi:hypothetical protein